MIESLLANLAIILLMHISMGVLLSQALQYPSFFIRKLENFVPVIIISGAIVCLFYLPIGLNGFRFDLATIPLLFAAAFHGWKVSLPILIFTAFWRLFLGGTEVGVAIVCTMILPTILGLLFPKIPSRKYDFGKIFLLSSIAWVISFIPLIFLPNGIGTLKQILFTHYSMFMVTCFTLYSLIVNTVKQFEAKKQLKYYAHHDILTGLYNLRFFVKKVRDREWNDRFTWLGMIDIDFFKQINDTYGHLNGDKVLCDVAQILLHMAKLQQGKMIVARYGGEEFICCFYDVTEQTVKQLLESIRLQIENHAFTTEENQPIPRVTISAGYTAFTDVDRLTEAMRIADEALYRSKALGRNRITAAKETKIPV